MLLQQHLSSKMSQEKQEREREKASMEKESFQWNPLQKKNIKYNKFHSIKSAAHSFLQTQA